MEKPSRLRHLHDHAQEQTAEQAAQHHAEGAAPALEFDSPEAALRHDAAQISAPTAIGERLRESLAGEPPPPRASWWRRLLGGDRP